MQHTRIDRRSWAGITFLVLLLATVGLAACGSSSSTSPKTTANAAATGTSSTATTSTGATTPSSPTPGPNATRTAVRACLAKKGITLPENTPGGGLAGAQQPKGMSRKQFVEALESCGAGSLVLNGVGRVGKGGKGLHNPFKSPRFHAALTRFVACLRQQGVNIGEPNTSGKGPIFNTKGINTSSPKFKAATTKCRSTLVSALRPNKASPGTAGKVKPKP